MIQSKQDLKDYMAADKFAMNRTGRPPFYDYGWRYLILLRKLEYALNCRRGIWGRLTVLWYKYRMHQMGIKCCGYMIPPNVCGKGLSLAHLGNIMVNEGAKIGEYCRLHVSVTVATSAGEATDAGVVGNRVYIGPGARLFGPITIADDIAIGANAVVNKSFTQPGITIGGIPAKKIGDGGSKGLLLAPGVREEAPQHRPSAALVK